MKVKFKVVSILITAFFCLSAVGCSTTTSANGKEGSEILEAKEALTMINKENVVFVDMQSPEKYSEEHVNNSVNISLSDIVINEPVPNMLAPKEQIEKVMSSSGISNSSTIIVYDIANNMESARLWWTLKVYGHENVKVVSGGLDALKKAGAKMTAETTKVKPSQYTAKDKDTNMIATIDQVKTQVENPNKEVVLLDTRTKKEFDEGTIPGSVLYDYINNNYKDGTYKSIQDIKINYYEQKITSDKTIIMFCKTSIRGAQTYLALYNAGYRNLKLYDGAWVEWSLDKNLPIQKGNNSSVNNDNNNKKDNGSKTNDKKVNSDKSDNS